MFFRVPPTPNPSLPPTPLPQSPSPISNPKSPPNTPHSLIFPEAFMWHIFASLTTALCFCALGQTDSPSRAPGWEEIVHGDLKPENVLLTDPTETALYPTAKLADFGMCVWGCVGCLTRGWGGEVLCGASASTAGLVLFLCFSVGVGGMKLIPNDVRRSRLHRRQRRRAPLQSRLLVRHAWVCHPIPIPLPLPSLLSCPSPPIPSVFSL